METGEVRLQTDEPHNFIICGKCGLPCWIIHHLNMSDCCHAPLVKGYRQRGSEDI